MGINKTPDQDSGDNQENKKIGFFAVMGGVMAAMFGVRRAKYLERDFKQGKAIHFIIAGIVTTVIFMLILYALVQWALSTATSKKPLNRNVSSIVIPAQTCHSGANLSFRRRPESLGTGLRRCDRQLVRRIARGN